LCLALLEFPPVCPPTKNREPVLNPIDPHPTRHYTTHGFFSRRFNQVKAYRAPRVLLAKVKQILAKKPSRQHSPLAEIIALLCQGRRYLRMAIYLAAERNYPQHLFEAGGAPHAGQSQVEARSQLLIELKIAGRAIAVLQVESERENAFAGDDRVLLENLASLLARFLTGPGKYLLLKARQSRAQAAPMRGPQSVPLGIGQGSKTAAVGE
jgi:hypothetical protein